MRLIYRCLCLVFGAILGSGCTDSTEPVEYGPMPEYGVPTGKVLVDGQVVDDLGVPVPGIEVSFHNTGTDTTDARGIWSIDRENAFINCVTNDQQACVLTVRDIDGADNGGPFPTADVLLNLVQTEPGSGSFDLGTWEQHGINIVMSDAVEYGPPVAKVELPAPPTGDDR
ncbi:hypothetical protein DRQ50_01095 [bacterium]|nr:MAG: hypothetical protein DRQ50_01095 [bacterium]